MTVILVAIAMSYMFLAATTINLKSHNFNSYTLMLKDHSNISGHYPFYDNRLEYKGYYGIAICIHLLMLSYIIKNFIVTMPTSFSVV